MRTAGGPGIRLDDLLARGITLQWAEAVALVEATCRQLVVTAASGFPSTAQIMLYEEGAVVALATVDQPQLRAAAHLLASVLSADIAVPRRLLVSQAPGAGSFYANLDQFAVALASCERRDRPALLRELYLRAAAAPARAASTLAPPAPPLVLPAETRALAKAGTGRAKPIVTAAVVIVTIVAMWFIGTRFGGMSAPSGLPIGDRGPSTDIDFAGGGEKTHLAASRRLQANLSTILASQKN